MCAVTGTGNARARCTTSNEPRAREVIVRSRRA
jgi:hypothetical protein